MATLKTLSDFKSKLAGGGARRNLFEVSIPTFVTGVTWDNEIFQFLCKSANLPASNVSSVDVPFRGRILKVAGDRTFDIWTVTVINDEDFKLRTAFEQWMNIVNKLENATGATNPTSYMVQAYVSQLGRGAEKKESTTNSSTTTNNALRSYHLHDVFPTNVSAIDLSYDSSDQIEDFTVELQVQYVTIGKDGASTVDQTGTEIS